MTENTIATKPKERAEHRRTYLPPVDIIEKEKGVVLLMDLPGAEENSLNVTTENNVLTVQAVGKTPEIGDHQTVMAEYETGAFERSFSLSNEIDQEKIVASLENGVLRLTLPKSGAAQPKRITVKAE